MDVYTQIKEEQFQCQQNRNFVPCCRTPVPHFWTGCRSLGGSNGWKLGTPHKVGAPLVNPGSTPELAIPRSDSHTWSTRSIALGLGNDHLVHR